MRSVLRPLVLALAALALPMGCRDLPDIPRGTCGNGVVEAGEDCDTFAPSGQTCRPAGATGACRLECSRSSPSPACPAGWGCGLDATCREPAGRFAAVGELVESGSKKLLVGDMDGDGRADIVAESPSDVLGRRTHRIHFFDDGGRLAKTLLVPGQLAGADVGDLTGDGVADLAGAAGLFSGIATFAGTKNRTLSPVAYPSITVPQGSSVRAVTMHTVKSVPEDDTLIFSTFNDPGGKQLAAIATTDNLTQPLLLLDDVPENLAGPPRVAAMIPGAPCQQLVFAFRGGSSFSVFTPCRVAKDGQVVYNDISLAHVPAIQVQLPAGAKVTSSVVVGDVDADGHLDVLVNADTGTFAAYGDGKGSFFPTSGVTTAGAQTAGAFASPDDAEVLAIGKLDDDGVTDLVTGRAVYLGPSKPPAPCLPQLAAKTGHCVVGLNFGAAWTEAILADFNRDGHADVMTSAAGNTNIAFFGGSSTGELTQTTISTLGAVSDLVARDLDGDQLLDLAFVQAGTHGSTAATTQGDALAVLFGRPSGAPEAPTVIGRFDRIEQVIGAHFIAFPPTTADSVGIISRTEDGSELTVSIFAGSGDRVLLAPLGLQIIAPPADTVNGSPIAARLAALRGSGATPDLVALAYDGTDGPSMANTFRLWTATAGKKGRFSGLVRGGKMPANVSPFAAAGGQIAVLRAADLDGDGNDEVVFVGVDAGPGKPRQSFLVIATAHSDGTLTPGDAQPLGRLAPPDGHVSIVDVDGDGHPDLVAATRAVPVDASGGIDPTEIAIFWGISGGFDLESPTAIPMPTGAAGVYDVAFLRGAGGRDLAFVTDGGLYLASRAGRTFHVADPPVGTGGSGLASGDVTGDGIEDLVVVDDGTVRVFRGEAVLP